MRPNKIETVTVRRLSKHFNTVFDLNLQNLCANCVIINFLVVCEVGNFYWGEWFCLQFCMNSEPKYQDNTAKMVFIVHAWGRCSGVAKIFKMGRIIISPFFQA